MTPKEQPQLGSLISQARTKAVELALLRQQFQAGTLSPTDQARVPLLAAEIRDMQSLLQQSPTLLPVVRAADILREEHDTPGSHTSEEMAHAALQLQQEGISPTDPALQIARQAFSTRQQQTETQAERTKQESRVDQATRLGISSDRLDAVTASADILAKPAEEVQGEDIAQFVGALFPRVATGRLSAWNMIYSITETVLPALALRIPQRVSSRARPLNIDELAAWEAVVDYTIEDIKRHRTEELPKNLERLFVHGYMGNPQAIARMILNFKMNLVAFYKSHREDIQTEWEKQKRERLGDQAPVAVREAPRPVAATKVEAPRNENFEAGDGFFLESLVNKQYGVTIVCSDPSLTRKFSVENGSQEDFAKARKTLRLLNPFLAGEARTDDNVIAGRRQALEKLQRILAGDGSAIFNQDLGDPVATQALQTVLLELYSIFGGPVASFVSEFFNADLALSGTVDIKTGSLLENAVMDKVYSASPQMEEALRLSRESSKLLYPMDETDQVAVITALTDTVLQKVKSGGLEVTIRELTQDQALRLFGEDLSAAAVQEAVAANEITPKGIGADARFSMTDIVYLYVKRNYHVASEALRRLGRGDPVTSIRVTINSVLAEREIADTAVVLPETIATQVVAAVETPVLVDEVNIATLTLTADDMLHLGEFMAERSIDFTNALQATQAEVVGPIRERKPTITPEDEVDRELMMNARVSFRDIQVIEKGLDGQLRTPQVFAYTYLDYVTLGVISNMITDQGFQGHAERLMRMVNIYPGIDFKKFWVYIRERVRESLVS